MIAAGSHETETFCWPGTEGSCVDASLSWLLPRDPVNDTPVCVDGPDSGETDLGCLTIPDADISDQSWQETGQLAVLRWLSATGEKIQPGITNFDEPNLTDQEVQTALETWLNLALADQAAKTYRAMQTSIGITLLAKACWARAGKMHPALKWPLRFLVVGSVVLAGCARVFGRSIPLEQATDGGNDDELADNPTPTLEQLIQHYTETPHQTTDNSQSSATDRPLSVVLEQVLSTPNLLDLTQSDTQAPDCFPADLTQHRWTGETNANRALSPECLAQFQQDGFRLPDAILEHLADKVAADSETDFAHTGDASLTSFLNPQNWSQPDRIVADPDKESGLSFTTDDLRNTLDTLEIFQGKDSISVDQLVNMNQGHPLENANGVIPISFSGSAHDIDATAFLASLAAEVSLQPDDFQENDGSFLTIEEVMQDKNLMARIETRQHQIFSQIQDRFLNVSDEELARRAAFNPDDSTTWTDASAFLKNPHSDQRQTCDQFLPVEAQNRMQQHQEIHQVHHLSDGENTFIESDSDDPTNQVVIAASVNPQTGQVDFDAFTTRGYVNFSETIDLSSGTRMEQQFPCGEVTVSTPTPIHERPEEVEASPTPTATQIPTPTFTATSTQMPTQTPTETPGPTETPRPTESQTPQPTATPTERPTSTPQPPEPSATPSPTQELPTPTPKPPTATPTEKLPTPTPKPPTSTPVPTNTHELPTATPGIPPTPEPTATFVPNSNPIIQINSIISSWLNFLFGKFNNPYVKINSR